MREENLRRIVLFFFLLTLDDKIALQASQKVSFLFKKRVKKPADLEVNEELAHLVFLCHDEWLQIRREFSKDRNQVLISKTIQWPDHIDLNPWKDFQKRAPENELILVLWVHILGVPESVLERSLGISEGTIRYRVGRGLSLLGQLNRPNIRSLPYS